jgi:cellulose synthase/poly-beta-1,6-N-acetylglucosamine synthase-like glycosyltransferase
MTAPALVKPSGFPTKPDADGQASGAASDAPAVMIPRLISVIIPVRNARAFIAGAVRSVLGQEGLADAGFSLEVVIVDDGCTDGSGYAAHAAGGDRVRVVPGPCRGIAAAMNAGVAAARGEFLARCDADDLYPPGRLAGQARWLTEHPEFAAVCGRYSTVTARGHLVAELNCGADPQEITGELRDGGTRTHFCTYLVRAQPLRAIGGFRPWFVTAEDIDLQLRLGEAGRVWYEPAPCYVYRLHDGSITHTQAEARRLFYENSARAFLRQRQGAGTDDLERGEPPGVPAEGTSGAMRSSRHVQDLLLSESWRRHRAGHKGRAVAIGIRACLTRPTRLKAWKSLAALVLKRAGARSALGNR